MCGITGYIDLKHKVNSEVIYRMTETLVHRGPEGSGVYISDDEVVSLGHRRLSFLDLTKQGLQPMISNDKHLVITFNGEIYNYIELKKELESFYDFKTNTDTEVILAGYEKWGIGVVSKLKGMFAFCLLNLSKNKLYLVRDRFGIKPLYYTIQNDKLFFGSELKAIFASNMVQKDIDFSSLADFFVYRYIPSPKTIWKNIFKIPPANYVSIDLNNLSFKEIEYWKLNSKENEFSESEIISKVNSILSNSVLQHTRSDVPIGSFLSGGYDSSALVLFMKKLKLNPTTFSIGFSNWEKSEDKFAKIVADYINVDNESITANEKSLGLIEEMAVVYDEPIADISIIPTFMVSRLAKSKVKAVLSGEGADEIFGGYTWQHDFMNLIHPNTFFGKLKQTIQPIDTVDFYALAMSMGSFDSKELKKMLLPHLHQYIPKDIYWFYRKQYQPKLTPLKSIQYLDIKCFMAELVLTKIDRASMANSLEVRVPFLDHELFEYIFSLNENSYYKKEQTKFILYKNIEEELPTAILERQKQGFVGPDSYYMNSEWYSNQLKNSTLVKLKIVNQSYIDELLSETYTWKLWKLLIMEKWFQKWI
jgi:asparagine synthase (glutamine-hydrolysing)